MTDESTADEPITALQTPEAKAHAAHVAADTPTPVAPELGESMASAVRQDREGAEAAAARLAAAAPPPTPPAPPPPAPPPEPLRDDGPTLEQYVAAGYKAENYPPPGYAARETPFVKLVQGPFSCMVPESFYKLADDDA